LQQLGREEEKKEMKRMWMFALLSGALAVSVGTLRAQEPPAGAPPPDPMEQGGGPEGPRMEILGFGEMHPGKVVTGAPYNAVAITETQQTLADGNTINRKVQAKVFRDSQGRTRREITLTGVGPLSTTGASRTFVMIHDPVAGTAFVLHQDTKVAEKLPARPRGKKGPAASADLQGKFDARMQEQIANGTLKKDDLGVQTINGISAQGTRFTRTIPAGQAGNAKPIIITNERWYSPDLQIVIKTVRNDPRFGETTYTVTNIQKREPAATLFAVPVDYTVKQGGVRGRGRMNHSGGPGPAPADTPPPPPGE